jgi:hypothetical protein
MDMMPDQSADARSRAVDPLDALLDRPLTEWSVDQLMALKDVFETQGTGIANGLPPADVVLIAAATSYATVFTQTLAKHHAEALIEAVQTRFRRKDKTLELVVGTGDDVAAAFIVTRDLSDEAKLAMLDVDVTSDELRGKFLRWDDKALAWRADSAEEQRRHRELYR